MDCAPVDGVEFWELAGALKDAGMAACWAVVVVCQMKGDHL